MHTPTAILRDRRRSRPRVLGRDGFTLVEILVVIMIIGTLAAMILYAVGSYTSKAKRKRTEALVDRLETFIQEYQRQTGNLPLDGMDTRVRVGGTDLDSSAALWYALSQPIVDTYYVAGEEKIRRIDPIATFERAELQADESNPDVFHIVDGYRRRLHYDSLSKKRNPPSLDDEIHVLGDEEEEGRWVSDGRYEIWSIGMREAIAEARADRGVEKEAARQAEMDEDI